MKEKAEKLIRLFSELLENSNRDEKTACADTPLCTLSTNDLKVLLSLCDREHPSIKEISEELQLPMSTLTGIFNKLVDRKFVKRYRCVTDRRVVRVHLTKKGCDAAAIKRENSERFASAVLNILAENEQNQLLFLLEKIISGLPGDCPPA